MHVIAADRPITAQRTIRDPAPCSPLPQPLRGCPPMIILYATDLLFTSKVNATARAAGAALAIVRGVGSLRERLTGADAASIALAIVDLDADDAVAAIEAAVQGQPRPRVLAYVSHVRADLIAAARAAGADQVMARSAFVGALEQIVRSAGGSGPAT